VTHIVAGLRRAGRSVRGFFDGFLEWVWGFEAGKPYRRAIHDDDTMAGWTRPDPDEDSLRTERTDTRTPRRGT